MQAPPSRPLQVDLVTEFPAMVAGFFSESMMGRALRAGAVRFGIVNPRDFAEGRHRSTDDRPYGGGPGMVMLAEPLARAVESVAGPESRILLMSPGGKPFEQADARRLAREKHLVFLCGHYEGIDDRVRRFFDPEEISIGDYVLTNGALAAACVVDAVVRLLPGVLGAEGGTEDESFETGLLDYPQFTRPPVWRGLEVPAVLQGGDHEKVRKWREAEAERITMERRPDMAAKMGLPRPPPVSKKRKSSKTVSNQERKQ